MTTVKTPSQYDEKLDRATILDRLEGCEELLTELIHLFLTEAPQMIEGMRTSLNQGNMEDLARHAHSMKGAVSNFAAFATASAAAQLEKDARSGDKDAARAGLGKLEQAVEHLLPELVVLSKE